MAAYQVERLEKYISDLLWKHDCVVIPGFGGFVLNGQQARFEVSSHELHPPGKRVSFNRSLINNDGLLHHYVAQVTGQSFESAQSFVTTQLNYWKLQLLNKKQVTLADIGTLHADIEGRWLFTPAEMVYSKAVFGCESLKLTPLEVAPSIRIQPHQEKPVRVKAGGGRKIWLRRTAGAIAVLCMLAVTGYFLLPQFADMPQLATFDLWQDKDASPKQEKNIPEPVEAAAEPVLSSDSILAADISTSIETPVYSYKFYIIGGSFAREENALRFKTQLEDKGYEAQVLHNEKGFFRVAYVNVTDSLAASQELQKIKIQENQAAWLLKW